MFKRVAEFHSAFGHLVGQEPRLPSDAIRKLRYDLIDEELNEYFVAFVDQNRVEMADALADLLFVLAGTAVAYGIAPLNETVESPYQDAFDGGILPPPDYQVSLGSSFPALLANDFDIFRLAEEANDLDKIDCAIRVMMMDVFAIAWYSHIPINAVFQEVFRSNMSKLDADGKAIFREDGKVLKGPLYSPPDIAAVLARVNHV